MLWDEQFLTSKTQLMPWVETHLNNYDSEVTFESPSSITQRCFHFRCSLITVVLLSPFYTMQSVLRSLRQTHFLLKFNLKCSHTIDDFGRTVFSASTVFHKFLLRWRNQLRDTACNNMDLTNWLWNLLPTIFYNRFLDAALQKSLFRGLLQTP